MTLTPEQKARVKIDSMLDKAGWEVQDVSLANIHAKQRVAIRGFPLETGYRNRYFTDSGIIGSKEFVSNHYNRFKDLFMSNNEKIPRPVAGLDGIFSLKRLSEIQ